MHHNTATSKTFKNSPGKTLAIGRISFYVDSIDALPVTALTHEREEQSASESAVCSGGITRNADNNRGVTSILFSNRSTRTGRRTLL